MAILAVCLGASTAWGAPPDDDAIVRRFLEAVEKRTDVTAEQKSAVQAAVTKAREAPETRDDAVVAGLAVLTPDLVKAIDGLRADDPTAARQTLEVFGEELDPFLAGAATDALARHLAERGRPTQALTLLNKVLTKYESQVLGIGRTHLAVGRVEEKMLRREEAAAAYKRALGDTKNLAPERRAELEERIAELESVAAGSLDDVRDRMRFSQEQLAQADASDVVRDEQKRIVSMLDKLIEEAEQRESQGSSKSQGKKKSGQGQGKGAGSGKPGEGAGEGKSQGGDDPTTGPAVRKLTRGGPQSPWGQLREKERDPAFSAIKEKFPARYQQLLEQYYKSFQEDRE